MHETAFSRPQPDVQKPLVVLHVDVRTSHDDVGKHDTLGVPHCGGGGVGGTGAGDGKSVGGNSVGSGVG